MLLLALALSGCQTVRFYSQAVSGQAEIVAKSRSNREVMAAAETNERLRKQLAAVEEIRAFATDHLSLPGNESYGRYADLGREHVTWVL